MSYNEVYDVVIIGGGVSGASQLYALSVYSDVKKVLLVEKESTAGAINSAPTNNSQTLHEGDIETNYSLEKAKAVKAKAYFTRAYLKQKGTPDIYTLGPKMVLGVGERECSLLRKRFEDFKEFYPTITLLEKKQLRELEPHVCLGRKESEELVAIYNPDGITVNYGLLARSLIDEAVCHSQTDIKKTYSATFHTHVQSLRRENDMYVVKLGDREICARFVSVCAGSHSMYFAKQLNVPQVQQLSLLPIAGNFYFTPKYIISKIYTVQTPGLPFSAVHGDPDILDTGNTHTRFGPTTRLVFMLERHKLNTIKDFFVTLSPFFKTVFAYIRILGNAQFFKYAFKNNVLFPFPFLGNYLFTREARKIIPLLKMSEVKLARGQGGVRPQVIHTNKKEPLSLGEAKFEDDHILFNVTPSPGASTGLYNGLVDAKKIALTLDSTFNDHAVEKTLGARP